MLVTDRLEGVTFWHSDAVLWEVAAMIGFGAVWSRWIARRTVAGHHDKFKDLDSVSDG